MDHDRAERLIGERLDGARLTARDAADLERHLGGCAGCRAFERAAWRLRERARFEVAPAVPDLVEPIMAAVRAEPGRRRSGLRLVRPGERRPPPRRRGSVPRLAPVAAAALIGALVGSVVVGGPWSEREGPSGRAALAAEDVTRGVAAAAGSLDAYGARFTIVEWHLSPEVPERRLAMRVWFAAPERFRVDIVDRTTDPRTATPTDLRLIVNEDEWYVAGPSPCPAPSCPMQATAVRNRTPFSSAAPAPTDLVLPLTALGAPQDVEVLGEGTALGREAVRVQVPFERAASLFPFLSLGGEWRPFYPSDRVRIWLDAESWFPLRWEVLPATGAPREAWARRFGLPPEPADTPVFSVEAVDVDLDPPSVAIFDVPSTAAVRDQGAREIPLGELARDAGFAPLEPDDLGTLEPYRAVAPSDPDAGETVVTYADGLAWLKIGESRSWTGGEPFGPVDVRAEEVVLANGGVGYFEPASPSHGRRLAIHAAGTDVYLETNLPRERLLTLAAGLHVTGLPLPEAWTVRRSDGTVVQRMSLDEARANVPFALDLPELPEHFTLASIEVVRTATTIGVALYFRDADVDTGAGTIRLYVQPGRRLPPASAARQSAVEVGGGEGRWVAARSTLEWVRDGLYRSLDAPGLGFERLLALAMSIPVEAR